MYFNFFLWQRQSRGRQGKASGEAGTLPPGLSLSCGKDGTRLEHGAPMGATSSAQAAGMMLVQAQCVTLVTKLNFTAPWLRDVPGTCLHLEDGHLLVGQARPTAQLPPWICLSSPKPQPLNQGQTQVLEESSMFKAGLQLKNLAQGTSPAGSGHICELDCPQNRG